MSHYMRGIRTPHNILIYNVWETAGDSIRNDVQAPDDYSFMLLKGGWRLRTPPDVEIPAHWAAHASREPGIFGDMRDVTLPAPMLVKVSALPLVGTRGGRVIVEASEDDTQGFCIFPLEDFFIKGFFGEELGGKLLDMDGWEGHFEEFFEAVRPTQVDPRTLAKVERGVSVLDTEVIKNVLRNDIEKLRVTPAPRRRTDIG